jgi:uncharacterized protein with HEPN domain
LNRDKLYVEHIPECIRRIDAYSVAGRETFLTQTLVQDAVLRNLQILAESASRISADIQERTPEIPWPQVRGFRNFVVHEYLGVDLGFVWEIVQDDLPVLRDQATRLLAMLNHD